MEIMEKVSHLKGLMEGMEYDTKSKEGKLISAIVDILEDMADELEGLGEDVETLYDYADELDEDLGEVESELYGDFDEDDFDDFDDFDDDDESCDCTFCDEDGASDKE